jgi:hypothetical protein
MVCVALSQVVVVYPENIDNLVRVLRVDLS